MSVSLTLSTLYDATAYEAAFRRISRLQPVGGQGDKIFPPTYPSEPKGGPPEHVFEQRRMDDRVVWCVLIDSVQSQANRLEKALLAASDNNGLDLPFVTVDFGDAGLDPVERITSLDAPHRIYDAILRDSLKDGIPFMQSDDGLRLAAARPAHATALLEISPTALLFGAWHSQGEGGGFGAKFPRTLVSEIMGIDTPVEELDGDQRKGGKAVRTAGRRTGSRIDPLGVQKNARIYESAQSRHDWTPFESEAKKDKKGPISFSRSGGQSGKPSVINHGNIAPSVVPLGVTCEYVEHRSVITLAGLRRLQFGSETRNTAGRALIAAIGLLALIEQDSFGYALRSRCDLVCDGHAPLNLVRADGSIESIELDRKQARALYEEVYAEAESAGFRFKSLTLKPAAKLIEIVRQSRQSALEGTASDGDND